LLYTPTVSGFFKTDRTELLIRQKSIFSAGGGSVSR